MIARILFSLSLLHIAFATPCDLRAYKSGLVCVCNSTNCDTLEINLPTNDGEVLIVSTSKTGLRFHQMTANFNHKQTSVPHGPFHYGASRASEFDRAMKKVHLPQRFEEPLDSVVNVSINRTATYQKILGFGGAFTGAVSYNLKQLESLELQRHVYRSYYSKDIGIGYNMMRIPIGGCDFDVEPWAYNEYPEHDPLLSSFNELDKRDLERIEQINDLKNVTGNDDIKLLGAAWSSPKWMKTNGDWTGFGALRDEYYQTWADYHVRYLELMHDNNLPFWAVSTGNEPLNGVLMFEFVKFMSLGWTPTNQARWLSENLGPSLRNSTKISDIKILGGDDQRYTFPWWFERMQEECPDVPKYIDGLAVHWYADKYRDAKALDLAFEKFPGKFIIASESCAGDKPWDVRGPILGYWPRCEDYILGILEDLNHFVSAWVDWNLILDEKGGPNYVDNFVDSPIIGNTTEIYKQPIFYAMGHFSRFLLPDSIRVRSKSSHKFVKATTFLRPDGYLAVVLYNVADHALDVNVFDKKYGALRLNLPGKSLHTLIYK